jgi:hypothetical protein
VQPQAPFGTYRAPATLRVDAQAGVRKSYTRVVIGGFAGFFVIMVLTQALPHEVASIVAPAASVVILGGLMIFMFAMMRPRTATLEVSGERLQVDGGRGGVFSLGGSWVGPLAQPGIGVVAGSVLHVPAPGGTLRIAGYGHRPAGGYPTTAQPEQQAEFYLAQDAFEALLAHVPGIGAAAVAAPRGAAPFRCALVPNQTTLFSGFRMMVPWFGTMALVMVLGAIADGLGLFDTKVGQIAFTPIVLAALLIGIVLTIRQRRAGAAMELEIDHGTTCLRDAKTGRVTTQVPVGAVVATRAMHRYHMRGTVFEHAQLRLRFDPRTEISVGVWDPRYAWPAGTPFLSSPRYLVGAPDWELLVAELGLTR